MRSGGGKVQVWSLKKCSSRLIDEGLLFYPMAPNRWVQAEYQDANQRKGRHSGFIRRESKYQDQYFLKKRTICTPTIYITCCGIYVVWLRETVRNLMFFTVQARAEQLRVSPDDLVVG